MIRRLAQKLIRLYALLISPVIGNNCRFHPTCSAYAHQAIGHYGLIKGGWMALRRVLRCQPFYKGPAHDPVMTNKTRRETDVLD